jgi:hypothetical protein
MHSGLENTAMATAVKRALDVARNDVAVKLDAEVVRVARIVAAYRNIPMAEYLSEILRPIVNRDLDDEAKKQGKPGSGPARPKPPSAK